MERTRLFGRVRKIFREIGHRLWITGKLAAVDDVFFLSLDEVLGLVEGTTVTTHLRELVSLRRNEHSRHRTVHPPTRITTRGAVHLGNSFAPSATVPVNQVVREWAGLPCFPGVVRGHVRLVRDPGQETLQPGDILLAERTDPGWVMLFPAASGLIVEHGNALAHRRRTVRSLLLGRSRAGRGEFYERTWNSWRWRALFRVFFSPAVMSRLGRDPACFRYLEGSLADHLRARVRHALVELDPSINPYLRTILEGAPGPSLPLAWREENFDRIRAHLDRLEWHRTSLEEYLSRPDVGRFDGFNLSDIFEYMSFEDTSAVLQRMVDSSRPGARLAYWNMLVPRSRPPMLASRLEPLTGQAETLHRLDQAFFYSRFVIEEVKPCG